MFQSIFLTMEESYKANGYLKMYLNVMGKLNIASIKIQPSSHIMIHPPGKPLSLVIGCLRVPKAEIPAPLPSCLKPPTWAPQEHQALAIPQVPHVHTTQVHTKEQGSLTTAQQRSFLGCLWSKSSAVCTHSPYKSVLDCKKKWSCRKRNQQETNDCYP